MAEIRKSGIVFNHGLAAYPEGAMECVVTHRKICLGFKAPVVRARIDVEYKEQLPKSTSYGTGIYVPSQGCDLDFIRVGCYLPVLYHTQYNMVSAYKEYLNTFKDSDFMDFVIKTRDLLNEVINGSEKGIE